jgi:hypothetical protein
MSSAGSANIARINLFTKVTNFLKDQLQSQQKDVEPVKQNRKKD